MHRSKPPSAYSSCSSYEHADDDHTDATSIDFDHFFLVESTPNAVGGKGLPRDAGGRSPISEGAVVPGLVPCIDAEESEELLGGDYNDDGESADCLHGLSFEAPPESILHSDDDEQSYWSGRFSLFGGTTGMSFLDEDDDDDAAARDAYEDGKPTRMASSSSSGGGFWTRVKKGCCLSSRARRRHEDDLRRGALLSIIRNQTRLSPRGTQRWTSLDVRIDSKRDEFMREMAGR